MVTINEDVHRPHGSRNVCSTPNFTNETGLYPGVTSGSWWDGPMVLPRCRHHLEASLADSHHVALNLSLQEFPGWVREDPVHGGMGPSNVLFTTGQECKVSFSKVLRCVSGPNTVITDVAWVTGCVPGEGGHCSSGELQGCCQYLVTVGCGAQAPALPQTLSSHQCLAGYWLLQGSRVQEKAGMLPGPEPALGQSWNVGVTHCHSRTAYGCAAPPQHLRLHHEAALVVLALLWGS